MALTIVSWLWGTKYTANDVRRLGSALKRNMRQPYRFVVFSDRIDLPFLGDAELYQIPDRDLCERHCFCRLRLFDPEFQSRHQMDSKIVSLDLDVVITGWLDPLFDRPESFAILQGVNEVNPCPFNASVMLLRAGSHDEVWRTFSPAALDGVKFHEFHDDQGWLWHCLPNAAGWTVRDGIYGFQKPGWPHSNELPSNARIVAFIGKRKPQRYQYLPWMQEHWRL